MFDIMDSINFRYIDIVESSKITGNNQQNLQYPRKIDNVNIYKKLNPIKSTQKIQSYKTQVASQDTIISGIPQKLRSTGYNVEDDILTIKNKLYDPLNFKGKVVGRVIDDLNQPEYPPSPYEYSLQKKKTKYDLQAEAIVNANAFSEYQKQLSDNIDEDYYKNLVNKFVADFPDVPKNDPTDGPDFPSDNINDDFGKTKPYLRIETGKFPPNRPDFQSPTNDRRVVEENFNTPIDIDVDMSIESSIELPKFERRPRLYPIIPSSESSSPSIGSGSSMSVFDEISPNSPIRNITQIRRRSINTLQGMAQRRGINIVRDNSTRNKTKAELYRDLLQNPQNNNSQNFF